MFVLMSSVTTAPQSNGRTVNVVFVDDLQDTDHKVGGKVIFFQLSMFVSIFPNVFILFYIVIQEYVTHAWSEFGNFICQGSCLNQHQI